ncbi:MAG: crossover junction endodeoxyribonuclease RuvC [Candidatus Eisenbacteria bacterium]|nr:crossover junction endodeoxyribonuclease RuvC [Candidatus Eisenbacteria bacterium]
MRVLGLDPGSRRTGYGVVETRGNAFACLAHGPIVPGARLELPARFEAIAARVDQLVTDHAPDCVSIEEAFYHESVRSTLVLGHVRGALMLAAVRRGLSIAEYSPREIKLSVAGNGGASKEQVQYMVRRLLGLEGALQGDAADALAASLCHLHRARRAAPARAATVAAHNLAALLARARPR